MPSTNKLRHPFPEHAREPSITICDKLLAQTMQLPDLINIELCEILRRQVLTTSHKMHHFRQLVNKDTNTIIPTLRLGQLDNKVKRNGFPRLFWNRKRLQCTKRPVTTGLPAMDLFLSSEAMEIPGADAHYSERLVRLPHSQWSFALREDDPSVGPLPGRRCRIMASVSGAEWTRKWTQVIRWT